MKMMMLMVVNDAGSDGCGVGSCFGGCGDCYSDSNGGVVMITMMLITMMMFCLLGY